VLMYQPAKSHDHGVNTCSGCLEKQREIDRLKDEVTRLKARLRLRERKSQEGFFGTSTPSSTVPIKAHTATGKQRKQGGAKPDHQGHGRQSVAATNAARVVEVPAPQAACPLVWWRGNGERLARAHGLGVSACRGRTRSLSPRAQVLCGMSAGGCRLSTQLVAALVVRQSSDRRSLDEPLSAR